MISISKMEVFDWPDVKAIYEDGIMTGDATFEQSVPDWEKWDAAHLKECRIVARKLGKIVGWAALTPVSGRCVYAGVAEISVYVSAAERKKGIGLELLRRLVAESEAANLWTLQAGIFPENIASLKIHAAAGFRIVGRRERIGKMNNRWRDTLLLERRSFKTGIN